MATRISNVTEGWSKWQIALAVGAPVALGLAGLWYYRRGKVRKQIDSNKDDKAEQTKQEAPEVDPPSPEAKAQLLKNKGNKYFKGGKYDNAIKCYTEAIEVYPVKNDSQELATFYQNRAAAYEQLKNYDAVIADCEKALSHNRRYTKAMFRRAKAYEVNKQYMECLEDVTAVCILENFSNQQSLLMADRVLKELGKSKANEAYLNREPILPSKQFIRTYFCAFVNDPITVLIKKLQADDNEQEKDQSESLEKKESVSPSPSTSSLEKALRQFSENRYEDIVELCTEEINGNSDKLPVSLLLRGTFYLLQGLGPKAISDFDQLLSLPDVEKQIRSNALIKRGSLKMQNGDQIEAESDFAEAVRGDPENSDIYHHRGQLNLLIDRVEEAVRDFEKSVQLSPNFAIAHVQKAYTEYRQAFSMRNPFQLQTAMKAFEDTVNKVNNCAEGHTLYGQALCDQQLFDKADESFKKALALEPDNGNIYVHRGLLVLQYQQDLEKAAALMEKSLQVDDKCEFAYETLGTMEVQRGNLERAISLFKKALELAKTEIEMAHLFSLMDAAVAQSRVAEKLGIRMPMGPGM